MVLKEEEDEKVGACERVEGVRARGSQGACFWLDSAHLPV